MNNLIFRCHFKWQADVIACIGNTLGHKTEVLDLSNFNTWTSGKWEVVFHKGKMS